MAGKPTLRAVTADETPSKAVPKTIVEAAAAGNTRALLVAMRARIATTLQDPKCPPRDLASLSKRIIEIDESIKALDAREEHGPGRESDGDGEAADAVFDAEAL